MPGDPPERSSAAMRCLENAATRAAWSRRQQCDEASGRKHARTVQPAGAPGPLRVAAGRGRRDRCGERTRGAGSTSRGTPSRIAAERMVERRDARPSVALVRRRRAACVRPASATTRPTPSRGADRRERRSGGDGGADLQRRGPQRRRPRARDGAGRSSSDRRMRELIRLPVDAPPKARAVRAVARGAAQEQPRRLGQSSPSSLSETQRAGAVTVCDGGLPALFGLTKSSRQMVSVDWRCA